MASETQKVTDQWLAELARLPVVPSEGERVKTPSKVCSAPSAGPLSTERWEAYGFDEDTLASYEITDITAEAAAGLGFSNCHDGIYIKYPRAEDSRVRWVPQGFGAQTLAGKYGQRAGTQPALYYPPTVPSGWQKNPAIPMLITEGEFKAVVVDMVVNYDQVATVIPCAVGGVFSWQSKKKGVDLIPDMADIAWCGRMVYLAFDSDMNTNPMVALALQRLTNRLAEEGADCRVLQWPDISGKGIDDYLIGQTLPRDSWLALLANSQFSGHVAAVIELNSRFTYCEIQQQIYDSQNNTYIPPRSFSSDFFTRQVKVQTSVKNGAPVFKDIPVGQYWLASPLRSKCIEPLFVPGAAKHVIHNGRSYLNTWLGWGQGLRGKPLDELKGDVQPFYDFLNATFGGEDPAHVSYLVKRLAWMFQKPEKKHPTWLYMMGRPLQGKSTLIHIISALIGEKYTANVDEDIVKGQFAEWRSEKLLVTFDDSSVKDPRIIRQLLKRLTTEAHSQVNLKYTKAQTIENYFSFIFATNSVDALLDHDDRRAIVLEADCKWSFEAGEWTAFDTWRSRKTSMQALLYHLMHEVELEPAFYNEVPPKTKARELVVEVGESTWDDIINYMRESRTIQWTLPATGNTRWWTTTIFTSEMLRQFFVMKLNSPEKYPIASATLVSKLVRYGARKCAPAHSADARGRMRIGEQQMTLWTWDRDWVTKTREEYSKEYSKLKHDMPELFPTTAKY